MYEEDQDTMASFVRMGEDLAVAPSPLPWREQDWAERLESSIERGANHLLSLQTQEGYWVGELEADTTLESDYIYYLFVLGKADPVRIAKLANYVRQRQLPDGGWSIYPGGPSELNASSKAYFALNWRETPWTRRKWRAHARPCIGWAASN